MRGSCSRARSSTPKFEQALRDGIRELGLTDKIDILGPVDHDQLPALIATATVCVVPAASDLTPNPTVVFPTKLLEYMACRRAIVAPKRETVSMVVENGREALLFEPGDPIDLARKVLRLIGEPLLRDRIAAAALRARAPRASPRARRAARCATRTTCSPSGSPASSPSSDDDDAPKVEMLSDDDFEATVFEEAPRRAGDRHRAQPRSSRSTDDDSRCARSDATGGTRRRASRSRRRRRAARRDDGARAGRRRPRDAERRLDGLGARRRRRAAGPGRLGRHQRRAAARSLDEEAAAEDDRRGVDDGTPVEGVDRRRAARSAENSFVAGEIDVPTPAARRGDKTPAVEFTAASSLLGNAEPADPDTGSRTPPIERRYRVSYSVRWRPLPFRSSRWSTCCSGSASR